MRSKKQTYPSLFVCIGMVFLLSIGGRSFNYASSNFTPIQKVHQPQRFAFDQHTRHSTTFGTPPQHVSITDLLTNSQAYHEQLIAVRGLVTQPELHLDETELYVDFVFRLAQGKHSLVVYGRHDRTRSAPSIIFNHTVEVIGTFWKEQNRNGSRIFNTIEAISVTPYPSPIPGNT